MVKRVSLLAVLLLVASSATAGQEVPFLMPTPEGWRTETIPFPLSFAPELDYQGLEEIRFAPGMLEKGTEDFWSYAFVWWVEAGTEVTADRLREDLVDYFRGLSQETAKARRFDLGDAKFEVALKAEDSGRGALRFRGVALTFDPFVTREPVTLNIRVQAWPCVKQERMVVLFELSPQPETHEVWKTLQEIRQGFRCTR